MHGGILKSIMNTEEESHASKFYPILNFDYSYGLITLPGHVINQANSMEDLVALQICATRDKLRYSSTLMNGFIDLMTQQTPSKSSNSVTKTVLRNKHSGWK